MRGGFRQHTKEYKEHVKNIVSKQAQGFILASFIGGFIGSILGVILIASIIGWLTIWTS